MATYIFQKIATEGKAQNFSDDEESRDWYRDKAQSIKSVNMKRELRNRDRAFSKMVETDIGRMYMFQYDPKGKDTLPYYDVFPLIFVLEKYNDGFLGMNLHYLPPIFRARLMDKLYQIERNDALRESKKLRLSYGLLNSVSRYKYLGPQSNVTSIHRSDHDTCGYHTKNGTSHSCCLHRDLGKGKRVLYGEILSNLLRETNNAFFNTRLEGKSKR